LTDNPENITKELYDWELGLFAPSVSQLTPAETIQLLSKKGYKWVEWRVQTLEAIENSPWGKAFNTLTLDTLLDEAREVADCLKDSEVRVSGLQVDAPENSQFMVQLVRDAAQLLNCPRVGLSSPCFDPCRGYRSQRQSFQDELGKWIKPLGESGTRVCLETHFGTISPSTALVMDILEIFPPEHVGVMWDPANTIYEGSELPSMALDLLGPYLAEVHLKNGAWKREEDGKWNFEFCDLSQGLVQWPKVLNMLAESSYHGPLIIEDYRWLDAEVKLKNARQEYDQAKLEALEIE
jgi:sugar phosphate isomerase/epimerase